MLNQIHLNRNKNNTQCELYSIWEIWKYYMYFYSLVQKSRKLYNKYCILYFWTGSWKYNYWPHNKVFRKNDGNCIISTGWVKEIRPLRVRICSDLVPSCGVLKTSPLDADRIFYMRYCFVEKHWIDVQFLGTSSFENAREWSSSNILQNREWKPVKWKYQLQQAEQKQSPFWSWKNESIYIKFKRTVTR